MKQRHIFVSVLDLPEIFPFTVKSETMQEREKCMKNLIKFIDLLEKNYKEGIYYIGQDIIGEKFLERFLFEKEGFLEIIYAAPTVISAHFVHKKKADKFVKALKKTLGEILPKKKVTELLLNSIEVSEEFEEAISFKTWKKMREIRRM